VTSSGTVANCHVHVGSIKKIRGPFVSHQGRKRDKQQQGARQVNWQSPFLWSQIETAATRAGKPWKPRVILKETQKMDPVSFARLTEQVIGRWIDNKAKGKGISRWSAAVLARVTAGNSPGGSPRERECWCVFTLRLMPKLPLT